MVTLHSANARRSSEPASIAELIKKLGPACPRTNRAGVVSPPSQLPMAGPDSAIACMVHVGRRLTRDEPTRKTSGPLKSTID